MKRAVIVNFGNELGGQYTKYAFFCPLNMSLFGRTKWTQDLRSENQNRLQGLGICLRHFPFCILKNSFLRFLQWRYVSLYWTNKERTCFFILRFCCSCILFSSPVNAIHQHIPNSLVFLLLLVEESGPAAARHPRTLKYICDRQRKKQANMRGSK